MDKYKAELCSAFNTANRPVDTAIQKYESPKKENLLIKSYAEGIEEQDQKIKHLQQQLTEFNSLTPKSVPAGTKNSRSEGFLLVKHKHTNIPTMM